MSNESAIGPTLATLQPHELRSRQWSERMSSPRTQGSHLMPILRAARSLDNTRRYQFGDPVRAIDWKAFARTEQLLIRETRDEAAVRILVGIDLRESMKWPFAQAGLGVSKQEIAWRIGLNLLYRHLDAGDFASLSVVRANLAPLNWKVRSKSEVIDLFNQILTLGFDSEMWLDQVPSGPKKNNAHAVVYWLSDGQNADVWSDDLAAARHKYFIHTLSYAELVTDWADAKYCYFDEPDSLLEIMGDDLRTENYRQSLQKWLLSFEQRIRSQRTEYFRCSDRTAVTRWHAFLSSEVRR